MIDVDHEKAIADFVASLAGDHDDLGARLRKISHAAKSATVGVNIHAHFLAFRNGLPTLHEFVDILSVKLIGFCLPRKHIQQAQAEWAALPPAKQIEKIVHLQNKAIDLFKRANKSSNRNGEFGEVITYLLIESVLRAPQFIAKMSLKTNSQMPVHGSDGIHLSYDAATKQLKLYWGEAKCYAAVNTAIERAIESVAENLEQNKMSHELFLIEQQFDLSGFPQEYKAAILSFLDPYDENSNVRVDVSVVFIAFDFAAFAKVKALEPNLVEAAFAEELRHALPELAHRLDEAMVKRGVPSHAIEVFFLPVASVKDLREQFQDRIGWTT